MPKIFRDDVQPDAGGEACDMPRSRPAGFRVYKQYRHKKDYDRVFKRRCRNVQVVELRFPELLQSRESSSRGAFEDLLSRVFNQLKVIQPHLLEYLQKHPDSLVEHLRTFFGVPVSFSDVNADATLPSRSAGGGNDVLVTDATLGPLHSQSDAVCGLQFVTSLLSTLWHKYDAISALESEVSRLSRENTELVMQMSDAFSAVSHLQMENLRLEQLYSTDMTSLTTSVYASARQISKLHEVAHRQRDQLLILERSIFKTENSLAMQCYLNNIPCASLYHDSTSLGSQVDSVILGSDIYDRGDFESFVINDRDCSTSAYHSDVHGSFYGVGSGSASSLLLKYPYLDSSQHLHESEYPFAPFEGDVKLEDVKQLFNDFGETLHLRIASASPEPQALPAFSTVPAIPPTVSPARSSSSPLGGDTKVKELKSEIAVLQNKIQRYTREIRSLKLQNEHLKSEEHRFAELRAGIEGRPAHSSFKRGDEGVDVALETVAPKEDTKVKELKAEISVLQKQIQRHTEESEDYQLLQDRLRSEESKNHELHCELTMAQRTLEAYRDETEALLRPHSVRRDAISGVQQSSTAVSRDNYQASNFGLSVTDVRKAFSSLHERLTGYESENASLRSQLESLNSEIDHLKRENSLLSSDTKAVGYLTLDRLLHTVTDALGNVTRTSLDELETACSEGGTSTLSQVTHDKLLDERGCMLESENQLYHERLSSLLRTLHDSSVERLQMHTTIEALKVDLHNAHQLLQRFKNQATVLRHTSNELDSMRAKCTIYDDQVDKLKQMNTDLSDLNNRLTDEIRTLEEKNAFSGSEIVALREEVKQLQSLLTGGQSIAHDVIKDRVSIIQLEGRCKLLDDYLSNYKSELESLRTRNADLVKSVMELRYSLEQQHVFNAEYARQVSAISESEGRLKNQLDVQQSQIEGLRTSVSSLNESLQKSSADLASSVSKLVEKERSEQALTSKVESLSAALKSLLSSIWGAKPFYLSKSDIGSIDLSSIPNFDTKVYYGVLDAIQKSMVDHKEELDTSSMLHQVNSARDKLYNILKCNYLLSSLTSGLCGQLHDLSAALLSNARSEGGSLSSVVEMLCDQVKGDVLRADLSSRIGKAQSQNKELKALVHQMYRNNPTEVVNRLKDHYEGTLSRCNEKIEQLSDIIKSKEDGHQHLQHENKKLMADCTHAAHALSEFEKRLEALRKERLSLCELAFSLLPPSAHSECKSDDLRSILVTLRGYITKYASYREKYQKLLDNPPPPKVVTVTVPAPVPTQETAKYTSRAATSGSVQKDRARRHSELVDKRHVLNDVIMDVDANLRYYLKTIKSSLRGHLRDLASNADGADTDYESPRHSTFGRSDTPTADVGLDSSDTETDEPLPYTHYDKAQGSELVRRHSRQFDAICDLLDRLGKAQSYLIERSPRVVYVDKPAATPARQQPVVIDGDMAVMHHFSRLCSALKEFLAGSPLTLTVDDVFYQLELVMLDPGDRERRRAMWNRCIGDMVSVVIEVLQSGTFERRGALDELERRCDVVSKALDEAHALCRIREEELHRRTSELSDTCQRLEEIQQRCRKLEVELDSRIAELPRYDNREIRALESELSYREDEVHRLSKELSKLQAVMIDLEDVNNLLSQQLDRERSEVNRLGSTVDKQQRQISSLNSELSHLELEAERLRRAYP